MTNEPNMQLTINGRVHKFAGSLTGDQLLSELGINPALVVAEINGEVVPRDEFPTQQLTDGDILELVTIVGGG